jgi:hypothetical protein
VSYPFYGDDESDRAGGTVIPGIRRTLQSTGNGTTRFFPGRGLPRRSRPVDRTAGSDRAQTGDSRRHTRRRQRSCRHPFRKRHGQGRQKCGWRPARECPATRPGCIAKRSSQNVTRTAHRRWSVYSPVIHALIIYIIIFPYTFNNSLYSISVNSYVSSL